MSIIDFGLLVLSFALLVFLLWRFDVLCLKRLEDKWVSKGACKRFCAKRQIGCQISSEDVDKQCSDKESLEDAKVKFHSTRVLLNEKTNKEKAID